MRDWDDAALPCQQTVKAAHEELQMKAGVNALGIAGGSWQTLSDTLNIPVAAWLVLSGASAGGFALSFVFSQWFLHAGDFWRTPVLADLPGAIQCL